MAKKQSIKRVDSIYSKTKASLSKYYKSEFSTTKANRVVVWEKEGYRLMTDAAEVEKKTK